MLFGPVFILSLARGALHNILALVPEHGPLSPVSIPRLDIAFPQGVRAVMAGSIIKIAEMDAHCALNRIAGRNFRFLIIPTVHFVLMRLERSPGSSITGFRFSSLTHPVFRYHQAQNQSQCLKIKRPEGASIGHHRRAPAAGAVRIIAVGTGLGLSI